MKILFFGLIFLTIFSSFGFAKENRLNLIQLNSISVDTTKEETRLSLNVEIKNSSSALEVEEAIQKFLEYFFLGLVLPDEKFWVNLNPHQPSRIIEPILSNTDLGRIMLYADLKLKKETSELFNPHISEIGREFWSRLYKKASELSVDKIPVINRFWIVPDEVVVYEGNNQLFLIKSELKVCLEEINSLQNTVAKSRREKELQDYTLRLMRELILPVLTKSVNESNSYADLRKVYQALILARWYKQKFAYQNNSLLQNINYKVIIEDIETDFFYKPEQIYRKYLSSFKKGKYYLTEENKGFYSTTTVIQYFMGGVNFRKIKFILDPNLPNKNRDSGDFITVRIDIPNYFDCLGELLRLVKNNIELIPGSLEGVLAKIDQLRLPPLVPIEITKQNEEQTSALRATRGKIIEIFSKL